MTTLSKLTHYPRYGSLLAFARQMILKDAMKELETLRGTARNDDQALSMIAEGSTYVEASGEQGEDEEPDEKGKPTMVKKPTSKRQS